MTDDRVEQARHMRHLREGFAALLAELAPHWPAASMEYVREEVGHQEFGEALENLLALTRRDGHRLSPSALRQVEDLAAAMDLSDLPRLVRLRAERGSGEAP